jgi:hypothetical protein
MGQSIFRAELIEPCRGQREVIVRYRWVESGYGTSTVATVLSAAIPLDAVSYHIHLLLLTMISRQAGSAL